MAKTKTLLIVESPGKIKTLNKILGNDFVVKASFGHVRDLPKKDFGLKIDKNGFTPEYKVMSDKRKIVTELKSYQKKGFKILFAPDPDREGEAIAWHLQQLLKVDEKDTVRVVFNAITPSEVIKGVENPGVLDINKVNAQQSRRILDRVVGYMLSPLLWKKVAKNTSAGRVQSVALLLVVKREDEIEKFEPKEYFVFKADFDAGVQLTDTNLIKIDGKKFKKENYNMETAQQLKEAIEDRREEFAISSIENKQRKVKSPPPYITSTLQQEASRSLGFTAKKAMMVAQSLYEGKSIRGENYGLITYMRTDSIRVSDEGKKMAEDYIVKTYGKEYHSGASKKKAGKKGKVQDAHEAIRPTYVSPDFEPEKIRNFLSPDEFRLYDRIWKRFLASQMKAAIIDVEDIIISDSKYDFNVKFEKIHFAGYQAIYKTEDDNVIEHTLVDIKEGTKAAMEKVDFEQKFTKPPARYTEASLIKTLEKEGIGRPSTYATIVNTIMVRNYVKREKKKLYPTDLGIAINSLVSDNFKDIVNVKFTAEFEQRLDQIEDGDVDFQEVLKDFYRGFHADMEKAKDLEKLNITTDVKCSKCDAPMLLKFKKGDKFLACSQFPKCRNTASLPTENRLLKADFVKGTEVHIPAEELEFQEQEQKIPEDAQLAGEKCDKCGGEMIIKKGRYGEFKACSNYPDCKNTKPILKTIDTPCPECGAPIAVRRSKRGATYYQCSKNPECEYFSFKLPTEEKCEKCKKPLYKKSPKTDELICTNLECESVDPSYKSFMEGYRSKKSSAKKTTTKKKAVKKKKTTTKKKSDK